MRNGFWYKVKPVGEDETAHPLLIDERRSLKHAVDGTWAESVQQEVMLSVKERQSEQLHMTGRGMISRPTVVETRKTLQKQVLELSLVDEPIPSRPERPNGGEAQAVLRPEDVFGKMPTEPDAVPADATGTAPERPPPKPQTVPAPGLSEVLRSRTEGVITVGEGEKAQKIRYEGPRFEIRGSVLFDIGQPVNPTPKIPKIDEQGRPVVQQGKEQFRAVERIGPGRDYQYPEDLLADQVSQEGASR